MNQVLFSQGWAQEPMRDATLEYRLSIYHARASDSGLYTCNTPNNKSHSIHIIVADVRLVNVLFKEEVATKQALRRFL